MADGLAPAIDKVGAPAPGAPEAEAGAPTLPTTINAPAIEKPAETKPEEAEEQKKKLEESKPDVPDGASLKISAPKPVEVTSVPETPVNANTPAGGTPRPELKTYEEPAPTSNGGDNNVVIEPISGAPSINGASKPQAEEPSEEVEMTPTAVANTGEKRKLAEEPAPAVESTINGAANAPAAEDTKEVEQPADNKKVKTTNGGAAPNSKSNGKAKKKEKPAPVVGKTARKTRSQGPVEV